MQKFGLEEINNNLLGIMPNNLIESYETFKKAFLKLKEFIETDNGTEKDRGAIINAFQYTFELWWKTLQKYMQQLEMLDELGPRFCNPNCFSISNY